MVIERPHFAFPKLYLDCSCGLCYHIIKIRAIRTEVSIRRTGMGQIIKRDGYLSQLISRRENGLVKVIIGVRRCGKSFLLFQLYRDYLIADGVAPEQIIAIALDDDENIAYRDPAELSGFIRSKMEDPKKMYYIFIDEVQYAISRDEMRGEREVRLYGVLNGLLRKENADIYVTGSNSKLLSKDVMTEFRGRGDTVEVHPLSFAEYYGHVGGDRITAYENYALYGGMPLAVLRKTDEEKYSYLSNLFREVYFRDIVERYEIRHPEVMDELTDVLCSAVGSLTNVSKLSNTLQSVRQVKIDNQTISNYLDDLCESFLFRCAKRYDVKGKKYFSYPYKYYCCDIGLRNVRLNLRQQEESHIMENIIYNELISHNYLVDVGVVEAYGRDSAGKRKKQNCEIDFVVNAGFRRYYIQSALNMDDPDKAETELRPLLHTNDFFKRVVVTKTTARPWMDAQGVSHVGLYDFLLDGGALDG